MGLGRKKIRAPGAPDQYQKISFRGDTNRGRPVPERGIGSTANRVGLSKKAVKKKTQRPKPAANYGPIEKTG